MNKLKSIILQFRILILLYTFIGVGLSFVIDLISNNDHSKFSSALKSFIHRIIQKQGIL